MKYMMLVAVIFGALITAANMVTVQAASPVLISELQPTGCHEYDSSETARCLVDRGNGEFIELLNDSPIAVDVTGWRLEYLTAQHNGEATPTRVVAELHGYIQPHGHVLLSAASYLENADIYFGTANFTGYLAKSGGHVRIVDSNGDVVDLVSWGSATKLADWPKLEIASGMSAKRLLPGDPLYSPASPFVIDNNLSPVAGGLSEASCKGLVITEIMPNPSGSDDSHEFIEFYNPTAFDTDMSGCSVRLNEGVSKPLPQRNIPPGGYHTVSDMDIGFSLPNTSGGTVWLITNDEERATQYPANLPEGSSWAIFEDEWRMTTTVTPGVQNVYVGDSGGKGGGVLPDCPVGKYRHPETKRCRNKDESVHSPTPCRADQVRNPATNRCRRATLVATTLTPCKVGFTRNPATNRCRSAAAMQATLTPCKAGQVRNMVTNRCKSSIVADGNLKPCKPGQERNPETNRCRKASHASEEAKYGAEQIIKNDEFPLGLMAAGTAGLGVAGYGAYEWRREIGGALAKLKDKISGGSAP